MTQPNQSNPTNKQELREQVSNLILGDYACIRVWEAWSVGTMTEDDFIPLEDTERVDEIVALITAHTNAEIAKAVKEAKPFPVGGSEFADGYMAGIKQYETKLMKFIERAKLKEEK